MCVMTEGEKKRDVRGGVKKAEGGDVRAKKWPRRSGERFGGAQPDQPL